LATAEKAIDAAAGSDTLVSHWRLLRVAGALRKSLSMLPLWWWLALRVRRWFGIDQRLPRSKQAFQYV